MKTKIILLLLILLGLRTAPQAQNIVSAPVVEAQMAANFVKSSTTAVQNLLQAIESTSSLGVTVEQLTKMTKAIEKVSNTIAQLEEVYYIIESSTQIIRQTVQINRAVVTNTNLWSSYEYINLMTYNIELINRVTAIVTNLARVTSTGFWEMTLFERRKIIEEDADSLKFMKREVLVFGEDLMRAALERAWYERNYNKLLKNNLSLNVMTLSSRWNRYSAPVGESSLLPSTIMANAISQEKPYTSKRTIKGSKIKSYKESSKEYSEMYTLFQKLFLVLTGIIVSIGLGVVIRKISLGEDISKVVTIWVLLILLAFTAPNLFGLMFGLLN